MILTLTINPAIDRNVMVDRLAYEDRGYILSTSESPGGRGINASRVIHTFGGSTHAVATSGGKAGKKFQSLRTCCDFPMELVHIAQEMRTNLTITDKQGLTVKLNELGPSITAKELEKVAQAVESRLGKSQWIMICGSVPPGVPAEFYKELVHLAHKNKVKTLLDTDGEALMRGLEASPEIVSPNQQEAERLMNRALITRTHLIDAVQRLHGMGAASVVLSLGSRGAMSLHDGQIFEAVPPRIDAVCPIGAGDALAAALVWSLDQGNTFAEAVRWGVACGTASAKLPGVTFASLEQTREVLKHVELRSVS